MEIFKKDSCGYKIFELKGEVPDPKTLNRIQKIIEPIVQAGTENVAIDLHNADYVNSGLIGTFINWNKVLQDKGKKFCLIEPNKMAMKVLSVCGVTKIVTIFKSEVEFMQTV